MARDKKWLVDWKIILSKTICFWILVVLADYVLVYFYGPQLWSNAGYFFGTNTMTTLAVVLFIEGAILFAVGAVWASGSMETTFEGNNLATNPYYQKEQWKQRREQTEGQNVTGKILMFVGGPLLLAAILLAFI